MTPSDLVLMYNLSFCTTAKVYGGLSTHLLKSLLVRPREKGASIGEVRERCDRRELQSTPEPQTCV
jgi:hypothetical protein